MQESTTLTTIIPFLSDAENLYEALMQGNGFELHNRIIFDSDATCADPCDLCSILVDRLSKDMQVAVQVYRSYSLYHVLSMVAYIISANPIFWDVTVTYFDYICHSRC